MTDPALGDPERVAVRGGTLAFWRRGHGGVPLLLVHGWPSTRRIWARNVIAIAMFCADRLGADAPLEDRD
jgi:pimeloyl-ACP methyl ester carboxylesterase